MRENRLSRPSGRGSSSAGRGRHGYVLGHELVWELEAEVSLKEIALLDDLEVRLGPVLEGMSATHETPETVSR